MSLLEKHADLIRIVRLVILNLVNFRFERREFADAQLSGVAVPLTSYIQRKLYIRVATVSHRTTLEDFHIFLDSLFHIYRLQIKVSTRKTLT